MKISKYILLVLLAVIPMLSFYNKGKADKNLETARSEFSAGHYRTVVSIYLNEKFENLNIEDSKHFALAFFYVNEYQGAIGLFQKIYSAYGIQKDPWFNSCYVRALISDGDYETANKFLQDNSGFIDSESVLKESLTQIRISPDPDKFQHILNCGNDELTVIGGMTIVGSNLMYCSLFEDSSAIYKVNYQDSVIAWSSKEPFRNYTAAPSFNSFENRIYFSRHTSTRSKYRNVAKQKQISSRGKSEYFAFSTSVTGNVNADTIFQLSNKEYSVLNPVFYNNNNSVIFAANDPKTSLGGFDLYVAHRVLGKWSIPKNIGLTINSTLDELYPSIYNDTLYYSSNGLVGFGGLDIYRVALSKIGELKSENIGLPFNSSCDDFGIVFYAQGAGFLISNRDNKVKRTGDDIFTFYYKYVEPEFEIPVLTTDKVTGLPVGFTKVFVQNNNNREDSVTFYANEVGQASFNHYLNSQSYTLSFLAQGYKPKFIKLSSNQNMDSVYAILGNVELELIPKKSQIIAFNNIYFDYGKADIKPESYPVLDKVYQFILDNPGISIELSAHTDSRGAASSNMSLSKRRAASVVAYLVNKGIDPKQLKSVGYGESKLVNKCSDKVQCSEEEHALNRRVELKILKVEDSTLVK